VNDRSKVAGIIFIMVLFSSTASFAGMSAADFFSKDEIEYTQKGGIITSVHLKYNSDLITDGRFKNQSAVKESKYSENWFNSSEMLSIEKGFIPYNANGESKLKFYNALLAFSDLAGMKYYSHKARSVEPFILKAYRIDSPGNQSAVKNIKADKIDSGRTNYFLMTDNKFGELVFKSSLFSEGNDFILKNTCVHPIKKFGFKINDSGEYVTVSYFLYDIRLKGYFFYSVSALRIKSDFFLKINAVSPKGFGNRMRAGTVHLVRILGIDWNSKIMAYE
jgi:hypothetical protein